MTYLKRLALLLTLVGGSILFASSANAMCVYNFTLEVPLFTQLTHSVTSYNPKLVPSSSHYCLPNAGGSLTIEPADDGNSDHAVSIDVEPHGFVAVRRLHNNGLQACAFKQDGSDGGCKVFIFNPLDVKPKHLRTPPMPGFKPV